MANSNSKLKTDALETACVDAEVDGVIHLESWEALKSADVSRQELLEALAARGDILGRVISEIETAVRLQLIRG